MKTLRILAAVAGLAVVVVAVGYWSNYVVMAKLETELAFTKRQVIADLKRYYGHRLKEVLAAASRPVTPSVPAEPHRGLRMGPYVPSPGLLAELRLRSSDQWPGPEFQVQYHLRIPFVVTYDFVAADPECTAYSQKVVGMFSILYRGKVHEWESTIQY